MKMIMMFSLMGAVLLGAGCSTGHKTALNQPVGPKPGVVQAMGAQGQLVVYTCRDVHSPVDYDYVARGAYEVHCVAGELVQSVYNDAGGYDRKPAVVKLSPGEFLVTSFVPGLGQTTIPVRIHAGQTTQVYLDGSANKQYQHATLDQWVKLPNGDIAGYSADHNARAQDSAAVSQ